MSALLRVSLQRTVELEVGLELSAVEGVVRTLSLPQGYLVSVTETKPAASR